MNLFVANWKMNKTRGEALTFARELSERLGPRAPSVELVVAPPFTALDAARDRAEPARWSLAAQDVGAQAEGAYTGEVSARMILDSGCRYVLVGHSERRRLFHEDDALLKRKLARAREAGLVPIYCLGETEDERRAGLTAATFVRQVETLAGDPSDAPLAVAYEPVWAIGAGNAATPEDAATARAHLAELLAARRDLRILYGGSVTPDNATSILERSGMDGFLIGGASLKATSFAAIAGL
ncbi:MAG TPA: triose-phosphate isomerase [Thermoanaerobaculia bacterium]|nr:triose-phosphate isomerase [Thermoanaerobaculia bacterium]